MKGTNNIIYPEKFDSDTIKEHWDYKKKLINIIERSGFKEDFIGMYRNRLKFLEENMYRSITLKRKQYEKLEYVDDIYSIKINSIKNIRILFSFLIDNNKTYVVLLHTFEEKDKKNNSKTSYKKAIPIAKRRLMEVLKND